jgi:hypothetical protein
MNPPPILVAEDPGADVGSKMSTCAGFRMGLISVGSDVDPGLCGSAPSVGVDSYAPMIGTDSCVDASKDVSRVPGFSTSVGSSCTP